MNIFSGGTTACILLRNGVFFSGASGSRRWRTACSQGCTKASRITNKLICKISFVGFDQKLTVRVLVNAFSLASVNENCEYYVQVSIKGVVLLSMSLSREVVPGFARILLRTSLGKKHLVRPLLRTEITQVVNRRAWYDATKLTTEVLNLYKVIITDPLYLHLVSPLMV